MGTNNTLESQDKNKLLYVFSKLKQRVIYKYHKNGYYGSNILLTKWLPDQKLILNHPGVRLFISHAGRNSAMEAIEMGIPVLALPLFGDQPMLAALLTNHTKMAIALDIRTATEAMLHNAIEELLNVSTYRDNARKAYLVYGHEYKTARNTVLYWVEHVAKFGGTKYFLTKDICQYTFLNALISMCTIISTGLLIVSMIRKMFRNRLEN